MDTVVLIDRLNVDSSCKNLSTKILANGARHLEVEFHFGIQKGCFQKVVLITGFL